MSGTGLIRRGLVGLGCCLGLVLAPTALARSEPPAWMITAVSLPTNLAPGSSYSSNHDQYALTLENTGGAPTDGSPVTVTDTLPAGITLDPAGATGNDDAGNSVVCTSSGQSVTCVDPDSAPIAPAQSIQLTIPVDVAPDAPATGTNQVLVGGGGAPDASASPQTTISSASAPFGPVSFSVATASDQAGAHADLTISFALATDSHGVPIGAKDISTGLPPGLVGLLPGIPTCPMAKFTTGGCLADTQIGVITNKFTSGGSVSGFTQSVPVYNLQPPAGVTAEFGFTTGIVPALGVVSLRSSDYGLTTTFSNVNNVLPLAWSSLTLWAVPADPSHNAQRGQTCSGSPPSCSGGGAAAGYDPVVFLENPTACPGAALTADFSADSWAAPVETGTASASVGPFIGCDQLHFDPSVTAQPSVNSPDSPAGLRVDLAVPEDQNPSDLATAFVRDATLTLPAGMVMSPSAADGLASCSEAQVGLGNSDPPNCPQASKIGEGIWTTPALPVQLTGDVYLAGPASGPITGPPYHVFLTVTGYGIHVKLEGAITPDPVTGQLTATFANNPQLPFSDFTLTFKDGPRALLATPASCGTYTTTADFAPWSAPDSGPDATLSNPFSISGCPSSSTFAPTFGAGSASDQAGAYAPFVVSFSRTDADQPFSGFSATLPPGLLAKLAGVPLCSDADANAGTCPAASQVGTVQAASGPGSHPLWLPGTAYLTGSYKGAPYGLAVEVPAAAGPFNLGTVVVRSAIHVDPTTAQVTAVSDPFPTIIAGIPLQMRTISIDLNRPSFTLNPTNCNPMSVTGILSSTGGLTDPVGRAVPGSGLPGSAVRPQAPDKAHRPGEDPVGRSSDANRDPDRGLFQRGERSVGIRRAATVTRA